MVAMKFALSILLLCAGHLMAQQQVTVQLAFTAEEVKFVRYAWQANNDALSSKGQPTLSFPEYAQTLADAASRQVVAQGQQLVRREVTKQLPRVPFDVLTNTVATLRTNAVVTP
jgi:hypothetical protein